MKLYVFLILTHVRALFLSVVVSSCFLLLIFFPSDQDHLSSMSIMTFILAFRVYCILVLEKEVEGRGLQDTSLEHLQIF